MVRSLLQFLGFLGIAGALLVILPNALTSFQVASRQPEAPTEVEFAAANASQAAPSLTESSSHPLPIIPLEEQKSSQINTKAHPSSYTSSPLSIDTVEDLSRAALVNIICTPSNTAISPISGSGVIIDPRGVILTNAHVAQYVLLSARKEVDLDCVIRSGSPAKDRWNASVLYFPQAWMDAHAADISKTHPLGTGEYDYAFLLITGSANGEPLPSVFPFLYPETRSDIAHIGDTVSLAAYPSEFSGNSATRDFLSPITTEGTIRQFLTFQEKTVDVYSLGATVVAQSGSSGGSMTNLWGRLIGIISTTSSGDVIAQRDLHALSLAYLDRDLRNTLNQSLIEFLSKDVYEQAASFMNDEVPRLSQQLIDQLK